MLSPPQIDSQTVASEVSRELLRDVISGKAKAWQQLVGIVHPLARDICKRRGYGRRSPADIPEEVALLVVDKLQAREFAALRSFLQSKDKYPHSSFERWLGVLVHSAFIDHLRGQPETTRASRKGVRGLERVQLQAIDDEPSHGCKVSIQSNVEVLRILQLMNDPAFPAVGRRAVLLWLAGHSAKEIASRLELGDGADATRILHAARQRLRRAVRKSSRNREVPS